MPLQKTPAQSRTLQPTWLSPAQRRWAYRRADPSIGIHHVRSAPHPPPHVPGQRVCREASAGVVDELQHSIEVMCPEDRQSVILCIDEVVNCDVPDQPSAYSADRSADGSLRSGLWWRSSSETGG